MKDMDGFSSTEKGPISDNWDLLNDHEGLVDAVEWAALLRESFTAIHSGKPIPNPRCSDAPRRRHADPKSAALSVEVARLLYPAPADSTIAPVIKYEKDVVLLRRTIVAQQNERIERETHEHETWRKRILEQGPWDETNDHWAEGAPAQPMPVAVSDRNSLNNIFEHLSMGGSLSPTSDARVLPMKAEPYYGCETLEFEKGIMYEDGRLDLCKKLGSRPLFWTCN